MYNLHRIYVIFFLTVNSEHYFSTDILLFLKHNVVFVKHGVIISTLKYCGT